MQLRKCYTILLSALGFIIGAAGYKEKTTTAETVFWLQTTAKTILY